MVMIGSACYSRTSVLLLGLAWAAVAAAAQPQVVAEPVSATAVGDSQLVALVRSLGDEAFAARERATTELIEIGLSAQAALHQGQQHPDREIRYRCERILSIIGEQDFQRRLAAFAAGHDDQHGLPGWERYRQAFGSAGTARALFVEMQKAEPEIMAAVENTPQSVAKTLETRCAQLQQIQRMTRQGVSLGSLTAMLFAASGEKVEVNFETGTALGSFCYQTELQTAMNDGAKRKVLGPLLGHWIERSDGWTAYQALSLAMRFQLKEGLIPACKVLENRGNQPYIRQNGILAIARLGGTSQLPLLEALLDDDSRCASQRIKDTTYETRIRDVALAALLIMDDQDPREFGFDRIQRNEMSVFIPSTVGFEDDEQRQAALTRWREHQAGRGVREPGPSP